MALNPQKQETKVEEHGKELFRDHIGTILGPYRDHIGTISDSTYFLLSHFLEFFDVVSVFPKIKKCLHVWMANVIYYLEHFRR